LEELVKIRSDNEFSLFIPVAEMLAPTAPVESPIADEAPVTDLVPGASPVNARLQVVRNRWDRADLALVFDAETELPGDLELDQRLA